MCRELINRQVWLAITGTLIFVLTWFYVKTVKPVWAVAQAFRQNYSYDSAQIRYRTDDKGVEAELDLAGEKKLSELRLRIREMTEGEGDELKVTGRVGEKQMYWQGEYQEPQALDAILKSINPKIVTTKTYKEAKPIFLGEKWLQINLPEIEQDERGGEEGMEGKMSWNFLMMVKPRGITNNFVYEGNTYKKIAFGVRKAYLVRAIEDLKNYDLEIKVSQINALVKAVKSSDDWDRDLVTFLIDKEGNLRFIKMELPQLDEGAVEDSIAQSTEGGENAWAGGVANKLQNLIMGSKQGAIQLGVISFDKFNEISEAEVPDEKVVVEAETLLALAQQELGPVLTEIMGGTAPTTNIETKKVVVPAQTVRTPSPASCIQYQIREGEFASNKCYSRSDYNDLMFYLSKYNNAIFEYNGAAGKANVTCNGFTEQFAQMCEEAKQTMQKAESDKQLYAGNVRTVIERGR